MNDLFRRVYSVSELTGEIKDLLEHNLENIHIIGELSNLRIPSSGHYYFTLKDANAQIRAVMFKNTARYLKFELKDGMKVFGIGRVGVYAPQGSYQIILDYLEPKGIGALKQALEDLKRKLSDEGLFDAEKKKPLPGLIKRIGVVTSPSGAAIRDFISVAKRRFADVHIIIYPALVQGKGAAADISAGIEYFNKRKNVDAVLITRGGGSFEDLFCFSEEKVVRSVFASALPIISAVGHEIDTSLSDFAADFTAPTPSAAAELIIARKDELVYKVNDYSDRLKRMTEYKISELENRVEYLFRTARHKARKVEDLNLRIDDLLSHLITLKKSNINDFKAKLVYSQSNLKSLMSDKQKTSGNLLDTLSKRLDSTNPYNIL
ncbi:exodeoxyribonuclease VII large subunit, partial [Thermodesulfobacteriota bacterium]